MRRAAASAASFASSRACFLFELFRCNDRGEVENDRSAFALSSSVRSRNVLLAKSSLTNYKSARSCCPRLVEQSHLGGRGGGKSQRFPMRGSTCGAKNRRIATSRKRRCTFSKNRKFWKNKPKETFWTRVIVFWTYRRCKLTTVITYVRTSSRPESQSTRHCLSTRSSSPAREERWTFFQASTDTGTSRRPETGPVACGRSVWQSTGRAGGTSKRPLQRAQNTMLKAAQRAGFVRVATLQIRA